MPADKRILLIFPKLGPYDNVIKDLPLSLLYVSRVAQKNGYSISLIDQRLHNNDWQQIIKGELDKGPVLAGISVMTGKPIKYALEVSKFIKKNSRVPVVWGGIHPTIMPDQTLENEYIDIIAKGDGEFTLYELADAMLDGRDISSVKGIGFKKNGVIVHTEPRPKTEEATLPIPDYGLVDFTNYTRFESKDRYFSLLTSMGCPHRCAFCYNNSFHKNKWRADPVDRTISHLRLIVDKYNPTYISVIDSDFFVDLGRVRELFETIEKLGWKLNYGFRGVRVDDMTRTSDELLALMQRVGVKHLHIGAESGSQKMLDLMHKDIKVEQTLEVNRRLKKFPGIIPTYNFFSGIPTETEDDIKGSTELILKLLDENPSAVITAYNQFTPYPGTELFDLAITHGLIPPNKLEDWVGFDQGTFATNSPWLTKKRKALLDMLYISTLFIDTKITSLFNSDSIKYRFLRLAAFIYRPFARLRLKYHFTAFFIEGCLKSIIK
jgi:radical SAM superfamily enzyme YgiQ (UPF0313 family)